MPRVGALHDVLMVDAHLRSMLLCTAAPVLSCGSCSCSLLVLLFQLVLPLLLFLLLPLLPLLILLLLTSPLQHFRTTPCGMHQ